MVSLKDLKDHWFSTSLYLIFFLFFLMAGVTSALTYGAVVRVQEQATLENASYDAQLLDNGSIEITFTITLSNPSRYTLHLYTTAWTVRVMNTTGQGGQSITLATEYIGPTVELTVPAKGNRTFDYATVVSDPNLLSELRGFINYSSSLGHDYTLSTIPYEHEFAVLAWIGEFKHDYVREAYLNDLVTLDVRYVSGGGQ
jgi:hypothetical protein